MKALCIACGLCAGLYQCFAVGISELPPSDFADTEVTTNFPAAFGTNDNHFLFSLVFDSTPSNNVQAAFGCDADSDGILSAEETDLIVGWDCGRWRIDGPGVGSSLERSPVTADASKVLSWNLCTRFCRIPRTLELKENGVDVLPELSSAPCVWFYNPDWNLVRLTARGLDDPDARFAVRMDNDGFKLIVR
mgnify:CR=1 FL=1